MFKVYILYSASFKKIYVGFTANLEERLRSHNELGVKGWTTQYRPWTLVHSESFEIKKDAMAREKELKTGKGREWIHEVLLKNIL